MLRSPHFRRAGAMTILLVVGCQPATTPRDRLPEPKRVGEHLRFHTEPDGEDAMCAGSLSYMDRYVHELVALHDGSPDLSIDYYWFPTSEHLVEDVCEDGKTCTFADAVVVTSLLPHEHELVHVVRGEFGFSQDFLEEGAAELWGAHDDRSFDYTLGIEDGVELARGELPISYYGIAGRFSAYVALEFGKDAFVEIGKSTAALGSSPAAVDRAFESVIGLPISEVVASYEAAAWRCRRSVYRDDSIACAAARQLDCSLAGDGDSMVAHVDLDCAAEHFIGPRNGIIWSELAFSLSESRFVSLGITTEEDPVDLAISLRDCDVGCDDEGTVFDLTPNYENQLILYEGRHLLRIELPADDRSRGTLTLTLSNVCEPGM